MATFYVTPTGSDSNNGTSAATSMLTINAAIQAISSVSYGNGYDQNTVKVYSSASGDATYYGKHASYSANTINTAQGNKYGTTVEAAGPHDVILDCSNKTRGAYLTYYSTVRGFIFTASVASAKTSDSTIEAQYANTQTRVEDCTFDNCTDTDSVCLQAGGQSGRSARYDPWVKRCTFKNLDCTTALAGPTNDASVWESILIHDSTFDFEAVKYQGHSTNFGLVRNITIDGCTTGRHVIYSSEADIRNSIVSNCAVNSSYRFYEVLNGGEVDNSLAFNNTTVSGNFFAAGDTRNNCKLEDPDFTDRAGKDFSLVSSSPAKATGIAFVRASVGATGDVFDLNSGSFADPPSMGAIKFTAAAAPAVTEKFNLKGVTLTMKGGTFSLSS